jgi:hypothetical protein
MRDVEIREVRTEAEANHLLGLKNECWYVLSAAATVGAAGRVSHIFMIRRK